MLEQLGRGGMGVVYSAYDPELDRRVAVKLLNAGRTSRTASERFKREAKALARLSHPNVIRVHDFGEIAEQRYIVMEFVAGQTLSQWAKQKPRTWREFLHAYRQAGKGLSTPGRTRAPRLQARQRARGRR